MRKRLLSIVLFLFVSVLLSQMITSYIVFLVEVEGESMENTYKEDDILIVSRLSKIDSGDVVICIESNRKLVKRCVAVPGDTVQIKDSVLYVNGCIVEENYIKDDSKYKAGLLSEPITLEEDEYIVLGDNRVNSRDSRTFGVVKRDFILGVVVKGFRVAE